MAAFTTIDDAGAFFNTLLYTGTGASNALTIGFQPDFTWIKMRSGTHPYALFHAPRAATNYISCDLDAAEVTAAESLKSFDADGFTLGTNTVVNGSGNVNVCWNWNMGTASGITTDGSTTITPSAYSFNTTAGQSVIKYAGNTTAGAKVAHGCGATPSFILVKNLDTTNNWSGFHVAEGGTKSFSINSDAAIRTGLYWNDTNPDSVNITLGNNIETNTGYDYIAYCFAPVQGFSKFATYLGNGDTDGTFVYTGFRPALIIVKDIDSTESYALFDNKRIGYNYNNWFLTPNDDRAEGESVYPDILSNGFKWRHGDGMINGSGKEYIYMAWAESPFCNSNGVPTNAR